MQLPTLLLAALSASALTTALPTTDPFTYNQTSETTLEKRGDYGWVTSYAMTDPTCSKGWGGTRPKIRNNCVKFSPVSNRIGINWGSWPNAFSALDVYSDDHCLIKIDTVNKPKGNRDKGAQTCVLQSVYGGDWRSVRSHAESPSTA